MPTDPTERGIFNEQVDFDFLDGDVLWTCLLCPSGVDVEGMLRDERRTQAVEMSLAMLSPVQEGWSKLCLRTNGRPALVVLPELAFGTTDWDDVNRSVRSGVNALIVIAGFGFASGQAILDGITNNGWMPGWDAETQLDPGGKFNGAWVWVHLPGDSTRCIVVLKNWPEQSWERAAVNNWAGGNQHLRLVTRDVVIYPVICFDLIHQAPNSARERILRTFAGVQRVVVVTPALDHSPHNPNWDMAIHSLTDSTRHVSVVVIKNNGFSSRLIHVDEDKDKWRQGSGTFISGSVMPDAPSVPHNHVRYVRRDTSGVVLREFGSCAAVGPIAWTNSSITARGLWSPSTLWEWRGGQLTEVVRSIEGIELARLLDRIKSEWVLTECKPAVDSWLQSAIVTIKFDFFDSETGKDVARAFLHSTLNGLGPVSKRSPEEVYKWKTSILVASRCFAAIGAAISPTRIVEHGLIHLQAENNSRTILIWHSPERSTRSMQDIVRARTESYANSPALVVVGGTAKEEGEPGRYGRLSRLRTVDAPAPESVNPSPEAAIDKDITRAQDPIIFWVPSFGVEQAIKDAGTTEDAERELRRLICEPRDVYV